MKKAIKNFFKALLIIIILGIIAAAGGVAYLWVNAYSPNDTENITVYGSPTIEVLPGDKLKVMTYNIGFGAFDRNSDYYLDGGSASGAESAEKVNSNLAEITKLSLDQLCHINFFQQVDVASKRSFEIDEASLISNGIYGRTNAFAADFKCDFVPAPLPGGSGKVDSGILTLTRFNIDSAQRIALTNDNSFPSGAWSRQPCMLVERVKLGDSGKELVLINMNFEMYDDGEVRKAEYKQLCEFMQMEFANGSYVIAAGGFNAVLPSVDKGRYTADKTDIFMPYEISTENLTGGWKYVTDNAVASMRLLDEPYSVDSQTYVVDGFITSPNTIVENTHAIDTDFRFSNHNPIVTEVTLVN